MSSSSLTHSMVEDGFDWLKYGQKFCQGEGSTRLYFRCKENKDMNCPAKKIVDCIGGSDKSEIRKAQYTENHNHPPLRTHSLPNARAHSVKVGKIVYLDLPQDCASGPSFRNPPTQTIPPKSGKLTQGLRSEVEQSLADAYASFSNNKSPVKDGYAWLKYGQKRLYGNVFSRTYFRCRMHKSNNCPAKKTIDTINNKSFQGERTFHHGQHNHPARTEPNSPQMIWKVQSPFVERSDSMTTDSREDRARYGGHSAPAEASTSLQDATQHDERNILERCSGGSEPQTSTLLLAQLASQLQKGQRQPPPLPAPLMTPNDLLGFLRDGLPPPFSLSGAGSVKSGLETESPSSPLFPNIFQDSSASIPTTPGATFPQFPLPKPAPVQDPAVLKVLAQLLNALTNQPTQPQVSATVPAPQTDPLSALENLRLMHSVLVQEKEECNLELTLGRN